MTASVLSTSLRVSVAGLVYAGVALTAGVALGIPRELFLAPHITSDLAVVAETPVMALIVWLTARMVTNSFNLVDAGPRAATGLVGLALVIAAENALSLALRGESILAHWALYGFLAAGATLVGLAWFALAPLYARPRLSVGIRFA